MCAHAHPCTIPHTKKTLALTGEACYTRDLHTPVHDRALAVSATRERRGQGGTPRLVHVCSGIGAELALVEQQSRAVPAEQSSTVLWNPNGSYLVNSFGPAGVKEPTCNRSTICSVRLVGSDGAGPEASAPSATKRVCITSIVIWPG